MQNKIVNMLLVEDDDIDAEGVRRAFSRQKLANPLVRAKDGIEALEILRNQHPDTSLSSPYILLIDLNMPRMGGLELIQEIRKDPALHKTVIFVLTTSKSEEDKLKAYDLNIAGFLIKSNLGENFIEMVNLLECYWKIVELPS